MPNPGIAGLVARKYQILGEQADTASRLANANIGYTDAQTTAYPNEAAARSFATRAGGQTSLAQANLFNTNANLAPWLAGSEVMERSAAANEAGARAGLARYQTTFNPDLNQAATDRFYGPDATGGSRSGAQPFSYGSPGMFDISAPTSIASPGSSALPPLVKNLSFSGGQEPFANPTIGGSSNQRTGVDMGPSGYGYSEGTTKVPGKGDGTVDTQKAMLAPGEAVLNRGAAEHLGRDTISLLNAIGARRMGLTVGSDSDTAGSNSGSNAGVNNQSGAPDSGPHYAMGSEDTFDDQMPGYAWGTPDVGGAPPGPGQTVTSGSWTPPAAPFNPRAATGIMGVPRPTPPQGTGQAPAKPPGYAKGTSNVPAKGEKGKAAKPPEKGKEKAGGKMSPHAAAHTPDGSGISPGIIQALMQMGGMGGAGGAPGGAPPGGMGVPPAGNTMAPLSMPPLAKRAA